MNQSLYSLFIETIKDIYNAEKQFLRAMPALSAAATSPDLRQAIQNHIHQTDGHVSRLDHVARLLEISPLDCVCQAAQGIVAEAEQNLSNSQLGPVLDACIILCIQKAEHYEICSYGTLVSWAKELDLDDVKDLLKQTLKEESDTNQTLTKLAERRVNSDAKAGVGSTAFRAFLK